MQYCGYSHINVITGTFTQKHCLHEHMSYRTYKLCTFITFLALKNGLSTNNHTGLLIVCLIINIFPFYFQTRICYVSYALDRHHNLLVLTHCRCEPRFLGRCSIKQVDNHGWPTKKILSSRSSKTCLNHILCTVSL